MANDESVENAFSKWQIKNSELAKRLGKISAELKYSDGRGNPFVHESWLENSLHEFKIAGT